MRLNLSQIETFYWSVRLGSLRAAARHLNLTQPTVSVRIHQLELTLDGLLLERRRQGVWPTALGDHIFGFAEKMLRLADEMQSHHRSVDPLHGALRLGVVESVATLCLTELLSALGDQYPALTISVTVDIGTALNGMLIKRELDLAFLTDPEARTYLTNQPIGPIHYQWIGSPRRRLPERGARPAELQGVPILTHPNPSTMNAMVHAWFRDADVEPRHVSTCTSMDVMRRFAQADQGITMLPSAFVGAEIAAGTLKILHSRPPLPSRTLCVCYLSDKYGANLASIIHVAQGILEKSGLIHSHQTSG